MTCSFFLERRHGGALGVLHGLARDQGFWEVDQGGLGERHPRGPGTPGITRILLHILYTKDLLCRVSLVGAPRV
jgi:hypothetical protein